MIFEWKLNMGDVIIAAGVLGTFVVAHSANIKRLQDIETKLELLYDWFTDKVIRGR